MPVAGSPSLNDLLPRPGAELAAFLRRRRSALGARLAGMRSFPMRPLGRDDSQARRHEESVAARFAARDCNLFALCLDPAVYRGRPDRAVDEALYRLFIANEEVDRAAVALGLGAELLEEAIEAGLCRPGREGFVASPYRLVPSADQIFLAERYSTAADAVYLSYDSLFMARRLRRELAAANSARTVIDLGTGSGILACTAAAVLGVSALGIDRNERALAFATINAAINEIDARFVTTSFAEAPIAAEALVVANPPFVFVPPAAGAPIHSDGGRFGLDASLAILDRVEERLGTAGSLIMVTQSPVFGGAGESRLVEILRDDGRALDLEIERVGHMAPFARYADFYREVGVESIDQLVVKARPGRGRLTYAVSESLAGEVCFG